MGHQLKRAGGTERSQPKRLCVLEAAQVEGDPSSLEVSPSPAPGAGHEPQDLVFVLLGFHLALV